MLHCAATQRIRGMNAGCLYHYASVDGINIGIEILLAHKHCFSQRQCRLSLLGLQSRVRRYLYSSEGFN
jgi:hypothetical protein